MDTLGPVQQSGTSRRWLIPSVILGAVIVLAAAFLFWWYRFGERTASFEDGRIATAPEGRLVSGFSEDLLPESSANIDESYRVDYENGITQPVARYVSEKSLAENIVLARKMLTDAGWSIEHQGNIADPVPFFYARKGMATINISLVPRAEGKVEVIVAYAEASG